LSRVGLGPENSYKLYLVVGNRNSIRLLDELLVLKLVLVPLLILAASAAGYRWGPAVGGWFVSLPLTSAPVVFFLDLEQGSAFASSASGGVILGLASISAFALAYCWVLVRNEKTAWYYPVLLGTAAFFATTPILDQVSVPLAVSFVGVVVVLLLVIKILPRPAGPSLREPDPENRRPPAGEIAVRVVAATTLVVLITEAAAFLGPQLSGLLTPFPVYVSVLGASVYRLQGAAASVKLVRGALVGLFTPAVFFLLVGTTIVPLGVGESFGLAIVAALLVHGVILRFVRGQTAVTPR
jgi:hypothetical protein